MAEAKELDEIERALIQLAREYRKVSGDDTRRAQIENELSALCLRRDILKKIE